MKVTWLLLSSVQATRVASGQRQDAEHVAQERHQIIGAAIFDEAEGHVRVPAKIVIDFLRNSRIGVLRNGLQYEAQRLGAQLKVGEDAVAIFLLIVPGSL